MLPGDARTELQSRILSEVQCAAHADKTASRAFTKDAPMAGSICTRNSCYKVRAEPPFQNTSHTSPHREFPFVHTENVCMLSEEKSSSMSTTARVMLEKVPPRHS